MAAAIKMGDCIHVHQISKNYRFQENRTVATLVDSSISWNLILKKPDKRDREVKGSKGNNEIKRLKGRRRRS